MNADRLEQIKSMPVGKLVLNNAIPAMLAMIMVLIYNIADLFFVGQTGDPLKVAAVALATPVFLIFMSIGNIFGIGSTSVVSRSLGKGDSAYAKKVSAFSIWSCVIIGILISLFIFLFMDQVMTLIGTSADIWDMVKSYLQIICLAGPFLMFSTCLSSLLRAEGQAGKAMIGMMLGNLINIVLDPVLILFFDMGVTGAAVATAVGQLIGALYYIFYLLKGKSLLSAKIKDFTLKNNVCKNVLIIGIPASLGSLLMTVSQILINSEMSKYGDLALAAIGVAGKITMITGMLCIGLGQGIQPLLGYCVGAKDFKRYKSILKFSMIFAFGLSAVMTLSCYLGLNPLVSMFLTDAASYDYAVSFSSTFLTTSVLFGMFYVLMNALQAAGAAGFSLIVNVSRQGLIYIPCLFILGATLGINGLVWAQPAADVGSFILVLVLYIIMSRKMFKSKTLA